MGKPASRLGDTTVHGGTVTVGAPTVLIGGTPAARVSDMHVCPMLNPGTPPPPHVGGPVLMGSPTVLICGQMAARAGDMAQCSGPPDTIAMGCPTVLIGESAAGGAGAPGSGGGGPGDTGVDQAESAVAAAVASAASTGNDQPTDEGEDHYLDVKFVDKAGLPVKGVAYRIKDPDGNTSEGGLTGQIKKTGVKPGNYAIELKAIEVAKWSKDQAREGEKVKLLVEATGVDPKAEAVIIIWKKDANRADRAVKTMPGLKLQGNKIATDWTYEYIVDEEHERTADQYSSPQYYFSVGVDGLQARSGLLTYQDWLEIELVDDEGNPIADEEYILKLSNGEIRKGTLDSKGWAREDNVPPVGHSISYPNLGEVLEE